MEERREGYPSPPSYVGSVSAKRPKRLSPAARRISVEGGFDQVTDDFAVYGLPGQTSHDGFATCPMSFSDDAPDSLMTCATIFASSSEETAAGR